MPKLAVGQQVLIHENDFLSEENKLAAGEAPVVPMYIGKVDEAADRVELYIERTLVMKLSALQALVDKRSSDG